MSFTVYLLYSVKDKRLYVGQTKDLYKRLDAHFNGFVPATRHRLPLRLIHKERFATRSEAMKRERFLKSLWGAREKRKILRKFLVTRKPEG